MSKDQLGIMRCVITACIFFYLLFESGLAGLIDLLQFIEVCITSVLVSIVFRMMSKRKRGLCFIMEEIAVVSGLIWMIINVLFYFLHYKSLNKAMIEISALSLEYGLLFSIINTATIKLYRGRNNGKNKAFLKTE